MSPPRSGAPAPVAPTLSSNGHHGTLPYTIAIVGAGFCGLTLAARLLRIAHTSPRPLHIHLIDTHPQLGGAAYGARWTGHILNVPAYRMGAEPESTEGFLDWLRALPDASADPASPSPRPVEPGAFVPRAWYASYLEQHLEAALRAAPPGASLTRHHARALGALRSSDPDTPWTLKLESIDPNAPAPPVLRTGALVLATGNVPTPACRSTALNDWLAGWQGYIADPWRADWSSLRIDAAGPVLVIGAGLTMIDAALAVWRHDPQRQVIAVSRRGVLPLAHGFDADDTGQPTTPDPSLSLALDAAIDNADLPAIRRILIDAARAKRGASVLTDRLRPHIPSLWSRLDLRVKASFLRHLRPWWDALRHRVPREVGQTLAAARAERRLRVVAGRVEAANVIMHGQASPAAEVHVRPRGADWREIIRASLVVRAAGLDAPVRDRGPFERSLLDAGHIVEDALALGVETDADGRAITARNTPDDRLFVLGSLRRGTLWESTAVPELRVQVANAAHALAAPPTPTTVTVVLNRAERSAR